MLSAFMASLRLLRPLPAMTALCYDKGDGSYKLMQLGLWVVEVGVVVLGALVHGRGKDENGRDQQPRACADGLCGTEAWSALRDEGEG